MRPSIIELTDTVALSMDGSGTGCALNLFDDRFPRGPPYRPSTHWVVRTVSHVKLANPYVDCYVPLLVPQAVGKTSLCRHALLRCISRATELTSWSLRRGPRL